jgi:23S rRNA (adenine2503-C2)-methyltransferase
VTAHRYGVDRDELASLLSDQPRYRVDQVWEGWYRQLRRTDELTNLPKALRARLDTDRPESLEPVTRSISDDGQTTKFLWRLRDGATVETVLMLYPERATVCISTQAGCAMACGFCATGQAGFERHLHVGEVVEQVVAAARVAAEGDTPRRVSNIVFMGMGEPLANYAATWGAVERLHGDIGISARHLTVSTVGIIPGIKRLATESLPVNLAVSLHAANDTLRDELVPINKRYPLAALADACADYLAVKNRRLSFEWAMIDGVNDRDRDADELAAYARSLRAHVNLIPLNPTPGYPTVGSSKDRVRAFRDRLTDAGANATIRANRGTEIDAACGQLSTLHGRTDAPAGVVAVALAPKRTAALPD